MNILRINEVVHLTGLSRVTIWRLEQEDMFPQRVSLSPRRVGWKQNEVMEWLDTRPRVGSTDKIINTGGAKNV